ncbi:S-layer homology domain-containing protein [Cohnella fermenti]|uniref:SLH domain-containing protein n=1 Tax=Cohnella fermenti TaxID=2565925 RepID=A0A4S4BRG7_9BACL|nr:S-layer homology domain-containing protein [Cohnella fermenti]THF77568.1 hypothetical protein E6C55_16255 [Cohnella fermenti]
MAQIGFTVLRGALAALIAVGGLPWSAASAQGADGPSPLAATEWTAQQAASRLTDIDSSWAKEAIAKWEAAGLVRGYADGTFQPNRTISRAEFAALLDRLFGYKQLGSAVEISGAADGAWYKPSLQRVADAGIMQGDGTGAYSPNANITRQEAAVMLAKAFEEESPASEDGGNPAAGLFPDADRIGSWARGAAAALASHGYISGRDGGLFAPEANLTRAEAVKLIDNLAGEWIATPGEVGTALHSGNLVVGASGTALRHLTVTGDLYVAESVGDGEVILDGVTVQGRLIVAGGGENSIILNDTTVQGEVIVRKRDQKVHLALSGKSSVPLVRLLSGADLEGDFPSVSLEAKGAKARLRAGSFGKVNVLAPAGLTVEGAAIGELTVASGAGGTQVDLDADSTVDQLRVEASGRFTGQGHILKAHIAANGVTFERLPDRTETAEGVEFDDQALAGTGVPGGSTSGSGNGGSEEPPVSAATSGIVFGDAADELRVGLATTGTSGTDTISAVVGELEGSYSVRYLAGEGSSMSFELSGIEPNEPLTLEIEEIHTRASGALAYSVRVNGQEVYCRTYEEASAGPNHYFVEVPAELVGNSDHAAVALYNDSDSRVNFGRLWAYSDFEALAAAESVNRPMTAGLFQPPVTWDDYASDLALVRNLAQQYAGMDMYTPAIAFDILYMHWDEQELHRRLDYVMDLSKDTGLPVHLSLNSWWGGTPTGPDGKGGYWTDVAYQQIVYDPLNVDGRGYWKLTTPNIWGNTPWLTMNNDDYNQVRAEKVRAIAEYISRRTAEIEAEGDSIPPVSIFTENEPLYWPYFAFNASPEAGGDFSPEVIADAALDGVTLDPEDGLSEAERNWMTSNLTAYIKTLSDAIAEGYGYDAIIVDGDDIRYPDQQLVENAYTHMFPTPNYPSWDEKRGAWETHMTTGIRYGAEWAGDLDSRYLDYIVARGKFADVNAERSSVSDMQTMLKAYEYGADYVNIYNYQASDDQLMRAVDGTRQETVETPSYNVPLGAYNFAEDASLTPGPFLIDVQGIQRDILGEKRIATADSGSEDGGALTFKVDNDGKPLSNGLEVQVEGRALTSLNSGVRVEVWAGPSRSELTSVATLANFSSAKVDVTQAIDTAADIAYVELRLYSPGLPASLYSWAAVWSVKLYELRDRVSGHQNGFEYTVDQMRERNLWVAYRADVERLLQTYLERAGEDDSYNQARSLYEDAEYVSAYKLLIRELSQTLPAKFAVKGEGSLGKYPVNAASEVENRVIDVVLYESGPERTRISLSAEVDTSVALTLSELPDGDYRAEQEEPGVYTIALAAAGDASAVHASGGIAQFLLTAAGRTAKSYPSSFEAAYVAVDGDTGKSAPEGYLFAMSQDPAVGEYVNFIRLPVASDAIVLRGPDGAPDNELEEVPLNVLGAGELLRIEMNEAGEAQRIRAYYGYISGTITDIEPISIQGELRNAFIELDGTLRFELGAAAVLDSPKATGSSILTAKVDDLGLESGDSVTVVYSPYTYNGSVKRAVRISEVYDTLISETFEAEAGDWASRAYSVDNIRIASLDSNYKDKVARPDNIAEPGSIVWKIESADPLADLAVEYSGRAIMGNPDSQSVKWYVSPDGTTWTEVGSIEPGGDEGSYTLLRSLQLGEYTSAWTTVYIKCELRETQDDTWASLNDVRIRKKAGERELDTAELILTQESLYAGMQAPLQLNAYYDNEEKVSLQDANVYYEIGNKEIAKLQDGGIKLLAAGTTTVRAYVYMGGRVIRSNELSLNVQSSEMAGVNASLSKSTIGIGDSISIVSNVYNADETPIDSSQYSIGYRSSDADVATVTDGGIVTGVSAGQAVITVTVQQGERTEERELVIGVARVRSIYSSNYAAETVCSNESVCNTAEANATYAVTTDPFVVRADNAVYALVEASGGVFLPAIRGTFQSLGGPDGTWPIKNSAEIVYKLDSLETSFLGLEATIAARSGVFGSTISVYAGDSPDTADQLIQVLEGGEYKIDLSAAAKDVHTLYVRLVISETAFDWGGIISVVFNELTLQP